MYNYLSFNKLIFSHSITEHESANNFFSHQHDEYEVLFIAKGEGTFVIEDTAYNFKNNTIFLIPPAKYHVLQIPPQQEYERFFILFPPELFPECTKTDECLHQIADEKTASLFYKLDEYADRFSQEYMRVLLPSVLSEILILIASQKEENCAYKIKLPAVVRKAIGFINNHLEKLLSVEDVAEHVFVSKSYLSHIFIKTMNISVARYIRLKKMYLARNLLKQNYPATYVAQYLGYENYSTFLRCYYAEFETKPSYDRTDNKS